MDKKDEKKLEEQVEELQEEAKENNEFVALQQKAAECEDKYRRALADYQNLVRRTQEQKIEWARSSNRELLLKLLPVLDTLILTAKHFQDKSLQLAIDQFTKLLLEEGVEKIKTVGEEFNPHTMDCVTTQEGDDNRVLEELRAGYMIHDMVLRTAQVIVGQSQQSS